MRTLTFIHHRSKYIIPWGSRGGRNEGERNRNRPLRRDASYWQPCQLCSFLILFQWKSVSDNWGWKHRAGKTLYQAQAAKQMLRHQDSVDSAIHEIRVFIILLLRRDLFIQLLVMHDSVKFNSNIRRGNVWERPSSEPRRLPFQLGHWTGISLARVSEKRELDLWAN
jgi:hypothetical protein